MAAAAPDGGPDYWLAALDGKVFGLNWGRHGGGQGASAPPATAGRRHHVHAPDGARLTGHGGRGRGTRPPSGDAAFFGSMGGRKLYAPIVALAATADGRGYWEVSSDGGVFAFGDARFYGSLGGSPIDGSMMGMAVTADGKGY